MVAILVAAVVYVWPLTLDIPLLDPDEGLHAAIAQEMVEGGDFITPRMMGEPFFDKPILFIWAQSLGLMVFGMNEVGARAPGLLFGLAGALTTGLLAWRLFDRRTAPWATLLYMTMVLPVALAQAAVHDVALVPITNLALLSLWEAHRQSGPRHPVGWWTAAGILLGLACLTKGLIGLAIVGIAFVGFAFATRSFGRSTLVCGLWTFGVAAVVAGPWYLAMNARHPGYVYYYFVERHALGFLTESQTHGAAPWWYYMPVFFGGALPWIVYLPAVWLEWAWGRSDDRGNARDALTFCWIWLGGGLLFLSVAHSKLVTYVSPLFPVVALLGSVAWTRLADGRYDRPATQMMQRTFRLGTLVVPVVMPIAMFVAATKFEFALPRHVWFLAVVIGCSHWFAFLWWFRREPTRALGTSIAALACTFGLLMSVVVPHIAAGLTAKPLAGHLNRRGRLPDRLVVAEERIGSLLFYLEPYLRGGLRPGQITEIGIADLERVATLEGESLIAIPVDKRRSTHGPLSASRRLRVGHYDVVELNSTDAARVVRLQNE